MKKLLLATVASLGLLSPAMADVTIIDQLSGTGDNVVFNSQNGGTILGSFNGQNQGTVDFTCLAGCTNFVGATNGNDIKITADGLTDLSVQVFDTANVNVLPTATDVFSVIGTGHLFVGVTANEPGGGQITTTFDLFSLFGPLGPGQNGFTLTAINGETINAFTLLDVGGTVTDFEHYRVDVATSAVPEPSTWAMMLLGFIGLGFAFRSRRKMVGLA